MLKVTFDVRKAINDMQRQVNREIRYRITNGLREAYDVLMSETPVWSARTMANYKFGVGARPEDFDPWYEDIFWKHWIRNAPDIAAAQLNSYQSLQDALRQVDRFPDPTRMLVWVVNNVEYDDGEEIDALEFGEIGNSQPLMMSKAFASMDRVIGIPMP